jgi:hypothetical protein
MNELSSTTTLWCSCGTGDKAGSQYEIVKQDWHGEQIKMKCPRCGHVVHVERTLVSSTQTGSRD